MAFIPFESPIIHATFLARRKRFLADMRLADGSERVAHCANTGSMKACLLPNAPALLWDSQNPKRKLVHSWKAIQIDGVWIGIDTQLPNRLVAEAIRAGEIPRLRGYETLRSEVKMGANSRVDILLEDAQKGRCFVEVKNVTLVEDGVARFPDAVTTRGQKHLRELMQRVAEGDRAAMVYLIQREDGRAFTPADDIDPDYGRLLREAKAAGVLLVALRARVSEAGVETVGTVEVKV